jgi:hypothetical protein
VKQLPVPSDQSPVKRGSDASNLSGNWKLETEKTDNWQLKKLISIN